MIIDAHHHFWRYSPAGYPWIDDSKALLRRDFLPPDLEAARKAAGVDAVVSVQARQTVEETRWLLELAGVNDWIRGVVGWVPLVSPDVERDLERFASNPRLRAVRHVLQDEPDEYMLADDFNRGVASLRSFALRYDILIYERQLPAAIALVDRHPGQVFVLDHLAKPKARTGEISPWRESLCELARRPNVYCKISGLATEADPVAWTEAQLRPYVEVALETFGPSRLMFGSDWPVCLLAVGYSRWYQLVQMFARTLSQHERERIFGATALEAYGLEKDQRAKG